MLSRLAPVGSPIAIRCTGEVPWKEYCPGYKAVPVSSGTAALALALFVAKSLSENTGDCEVILPAYGCPDLISAAVYAGVEPVLVDFDEGEPRLSLNKVAEAVNARTVAIVAVNFLGIPERLLELKGVAEANNCLLIEDNAQWFPDEGADLVGDCAIASFGRGKPINLMGGGLLLLRDDLTPPGLKMEGRAERLSGMLYTGKLLAYNILITPQFYGLLDRLPFLAAGETIYKELADIALMPMYAQRLILANIESYRARDLSTQMALSEMVLRSGGLIDLPETALGVGAARKARLLRYPLLARRPENRDYLLEVLCSEGLGATTMYERPLMEIPGVVSHASLYEKDDNARSFAQRLLTLPTHQLVSDKHLNRLAELLSLSEEW